MGRKKYQIDLALKFWRLTHWAKRVAGVAPFRQIFSIIVSDRALRASFIPVREEVEVPPGVVAPRLVLEDYIRRASHRVIIHECPCRSGQGCTEHPGDLGCMMLGDAALDVDPGIGRRATVEEGLAHLERALGEGLLPLVGHLRIDKTVFGVRDFSKFLTMCFCCSCCCIARSGMKNIVGAYPKSLVRLDGVHVEVKDGCVGCGECVPACPVENITLVDGAAVMGEACLGCGTCVEACSRGHVEMTIRPDSAMLDDLKRRVEAGVDIE